MRQGRKPISEKRQSVLEEPEDIFGNMLKLEPALKAELEAKGLEGRFIDYKKLIEFGGFHKHGWTPYKRENNAFESGIEFKTGSDPDGLVRRGTCILAVKPKEKVEQHRKYLAARAQRYNSLVYNKQKADEVRQFAKDNRIETEVTTGYEENE